MTSVLCRVRSEKMSRKNKRTPCSPGHAGLSLPFNSASRSYKKKSSTMTCVLFDSFFLTRFVHKHQPRACCFRALCMYDRCCVLFMCHSKLCVLSEPIFDCLCVCMHVCVVQKNQRTLGEFRLADIKPCLFWFQVCSLVHWNSARLLSN